MDYGKTNQRMMILAIETSGPHASLCLAENGNILCHQHWTTERNHDAHLFPALQQVMDILGSQALDYILVGSGPGSYGGVRVALAAAVGISTVTGARTVALCSWEAPAENKACVISDARRGGWTLRRPNGEISVITTNELQQLAANRDVILYTVESEKRMQEIGVVAAQYGIIPTAEGLVQAWHQLTPDEQARHAALPPEPIYVRPPHITEAKRKPWEIRS